MAIYFKGLFLVSDEQFFLLLIFYTEEQNLVKIKNNLLVLTKVKVMKSKVNSVLDPFYKPLIFSDVLEQIINECSNDMRFENN